MGTSDIVFLSIFAFVILCFVSRELHSRYIKSQATEWFQLSQGARDMLGAVDTTSDTGFFANMKKAVAESSVVMDKMGGFYYNYNLIDNVFIAHDIDFINQHKSDVPVEELHKHIGLYPGRVEHMLQSSKKFRDITDAEWDIISVQYQLRLDACLAELNMLELNAEAISAGYHSVSRQVAHTDSARKQLRETFEQQWESEYSAALS